MADLSDALKEENWDKAIQYLKRSRLETVNATFIISKIYGKLQDKNKVDELYNIVMIIASYSISVMQEELKDGIRTLLNLQCFDKVFLIFNVLFEKQKKVDEYIVNFTLSECFMNKTHIDHCYKLILAYYEQNNNVSHSFWQSSIENLIKLGFNNEANHLIKIYPIKYSYSETLFKVVIREKIKYKLSSELVELLFYKYENRGVGDDLKTYESIFSTLFEEFFNSYELVGIENIEKAFNYVVNKRLKLNSIIMENFLIKIAVMNIYNFAVVEKYLITMDTLIDQKTILRIIEEYHKVKDYFNILNIIRLCKSNKVKVNFDILMLKPEISMEVIRFMMENVELNYASSFVETLSIENQEYFVRSKLGPNDLKNELSVDTKGNYTSFSMVDINNMSATGLNNYQAKGVAVSKTNGNSTEEDINRVDDFEVVEKDK